MHPNPTFRKATTTQNIAFAKEQGFGVLAVSIEGAPLLSHVPFVLSQDSTMAELHLVRSNPIARALSGPTGATIAISGPHSYISPDWYGVDDQVPTWNYVAVHLSGTLEQRPSEELAPMLDRLSAQFEGRLAPKAPWKSDKMSDGVMEKMMRQIVPYQFHIAEVSGTWKLNQNKADEVRVSAADHVEAYGIGSETQLLAALMRAPTSQSD